MLTNEQVEALLDFAADLIDATRSASAQRRALMPRSRACHLRLQSSPSGTPHTLSR